MEYIDMESAIEKIVPFLVKDKIRKSEKIKSRQDQYRSLAAQVIIRYALKTKLNIPYKLMKLAADERGKPYLEGDLQCFFNISHSEEWVVCALDKSPVGIDIEKVLPIDYLGVAQRYFSQKEHKALMEHEKKNRLNYFYDIWTLKESYVKNTGVGITSEMNSFTIETNGSVPVLTAGAFMSDVFFKQYHVDKNYKMAVCTNHNEFPERLSVLELGTVIDSLTEVIPIEEYPDKGNINKKAIF